MSTAKRSQTAGQKGIISTGFSRFGKVFAHFFLIFWAITVTVPLLWVVMSSLKSNTEILASPWSLPEKLQWDNFARAWTAANFGQYLFNTVIVAVLSVLLVLVLSSMMAFTLAKFEFPGKNLITGLFVGVMTFPGVLSLLPLFYLVLALNLINSLFGLILIYAAFGIAFSTFFLVSFFQTLPNELVEAARIDGCSWFGAFFRIMLPLARPGLVGVGIFQFMSKWNEFLLPLILIADDDKYVLGVGLVRLSIQQGYRGDWGALYAGMVITMLPVLFLYLVFNRHIRSGVTAGAVKM